MRVLYPSRIGIWSVGFCGGRKTLGARRGTNNKHNHTRHRAGIESAPHWPGGRRTLLQLRHPFSTK